MNKAEVINGRDVRVIIDGKQFLQAENAEIYTVRDIHKVRTCFCNDDIAFVKGKRQYKLNLTGLRIKQPFKSLNLYDLDNFTVVIFYDNMKITLSGCIWSDIVSAADKEKYRERISIQALKMETEEVEKTE